MCVILVILMLCSLQKYYLLYISQSYEYSFRTSNCAATKWHTNAIYYSHPIKVNVYVPFGSEIIDVEIQKGKLDPL